MATGALEPARPVSRLRWLWVAGGMVAGTLDLVYAIAFSAWHHVPARRVLQSVASGILGSAAYDGGNATAALGVVLHFAIMLAFAAAYYAASGRFPLLVRAAVPCGAIYGVMIDAAMNLVVLPLSAFPHKVSFAPTLLVANLLAHVLLVGLPIALATRAARSPVADTPIG